MRIYDSDVRPGTREGRKGGNIVTQRGSLWDVPSPRASNENGLSLSISLKSFATISIHDADVSLSQFALHWRSSVPRCGRTW